MESEEWNLGDPFAHEHRSGAMHFSGPVLTDEQLSDIFDYVTTKWAARSPDYVLLEDRVLETK